METAQEYENAYTEESFIGRGSFGAALLVRSKKTGRRFVAKKMMLEGLSNKEQESCKTES